MCLCRPLHEKFVISTPRDFLGFKKSTFWTRREGRASVNQSKQLDSRNRFASGWVMVLNLQLK
jgi:hypothetical protein